MIKEYGVKNKKILIAVAIVLVIIAVGLVITVTKGLNFGLKYSKCERASVFIDADFENDEIKEIAREVLGNGKIYIQRSILSDNVVYITAKTISEEQLGDMIAKINEKYELEIDAEESSAVVQIPNSRGRDIVIPYLTQTSIAVIVVLGYLYIMYKKVGVLKVTGISIGLLAATQLLFLSALAILRIPINIVTMPISLLVFLLTTVAITMILAHEKAELKRVTKKVK